MRTYRKLRQIIHDPRRKSVVFYNELFEDTKVLRMPQETAIHRDWRALCRMAEYYQQHLDKKVILLSEMQHTSSSVEVLSTQQYLDRYFPDHPLLQNLVHVLKDVVHEDEHMEKIRFSSNKMGMTTGEAVAGYKEVGFKKNRIGSE
jgi:DIS3-like exonuclease 1